ncbi:MAG: SRPBCC domain-containing protein [Chitinophagaceae bacterium]|nr:SRPBCC domain-containing protein [Chitinophagaceae bacterium]
MSTTRNTKVISASPERVYRAFTSPDALEAWLVPGDMTGKVHRFHLREGGGYEMSLFYPETEKKMQGKTEAKEDRYTARFEALEPGKRIVEAIRFDTPDAQFQGEMTLEVHFEPVGQGSTRVTMIFDNIPEGIRPEDNKKGTELSLQKLEQYLLEKIEK